MRAKNDVVSSRVSDFKISKYTFEIGGRKKGKKQIADVPYGIVVRDDIEYGSRNVIALWHLALIISPLESPPFNPSLRGVGRWEMQQEKQG